MIGLVSTKLVDLTLLTRLQAMVWRAFQKPVAIYTAMTAEQYHKIVADAQEAINATGFVQMLAHDLRSTLRFLLASKEVMVQSNLYLRAVRPCVAGDSLDWHRESFYGGSPHAINLWMPVMGVTPENALRYVPGSEHIPDGDIETVPVEPMAKRYSAGHKIGMPYLPKRIVGGVDISQSRPVLLEPGGVALFPSSLIHGAAVNTTERIRFSVDFRLIAREHVEQKAEHFASGREYYEPLRAA